MLCLADEDLVVELDKIAFLVVLEIDLVDDLRKLLLILDVHVLELVYDLLELDPLPEGLLNRAPEHLTHSIEAAENYLL